MRLLAVGEQKRSGLILCKPHYAEFAGPGAAICSPFNAGYSQIIAIGSPDIVEVKGYEERQRAYGRRIQWVRWLHRIVSEPDATQRAEKLFAGFEEFFGSEVLTGISNDVLALLAGVLPRTITLLRSQHSHIERGKGISGAHAVNQLDIRVIWLSDKCNVLESDYAPSAGTTHLANVFSAFPCSA